MNFTPKSDIAIKFPVRKASDNLMTSGRKIGLGMMGGSKIGMLAGGIFGLGLTLLVGPGAVAATAGITVAQALLGVTIGAGAIGAGAGTVLGGAKGCIDAACNGHDVDVPIVNSAFQSHINASMISIREIISKGFISLKNAVCDEFDSQITRKAKELAESIEQIKELIKSTEIDAVKLNTLTEFSGVVSAQIAALESYEKDGFVNTGKIKAEENASNESAASATEYSFL